MLCSTPSSRTALQTWKAEEPKTAPQDEPAHPEKAAMARQIDCGLKRGLVGSELPGALTMGQWPRNPQLEMEGRRLGD